jgi:NADH:ubiquinone oxidoreductase subunit 5 (subunit L)/multisubunit Na+/H+ antiporter MnhA subunit
MVYQGVVETGKTGGIAWVIWLAAAMLGSALTLASFVKVLHAVFLRKPTPEIAGRNIRETGFAMWFPASLLALLCVLFGVLAYRLPLKGMIFPAVGRLVPFLDWRPGTAAVLLFAGYALGLLFYYFSTVRKARECETYIGGEILGRTYISGEKAQGAERDVEVTGVDFYETIQDLVPLRGIYEAARRKLFDIYDVGTAFIFYFVEGLRKAHPGRLPIYLTWILAGFLILLWALTSGAPPQ